MNSEGRWMKYLKRLLFFLVLFDLAIAIPALFFPGWIIELGKLNSDQVVGAMYRSGHIEPIFLRGIGLLWLLAAYVQFIAWRDPPNRLQAINIALVFRFAGGTFELIEIAYLLRQVNFGDPLIFWVLGFFAGGDYILVGVLIFLLNRLGLK